MDQVLLFYSLLFIVAFLYASVGHGGASGYLALDGIVCGFSGCYEADSIAVKPFCFP